MRRAADIEHKKLHDLMTSILAHMGMHLHIHCTETPLKLQDGHYGSPISLLRGYSTILLQ